MDNVTTENPLGFPHHRGALSGCELCANTEVGWGGVCAAWKAPADPHRGGPGPERKQMLGEAQTLTGLFRVLQPPDKTKTILRARAHRVRPEVAVGVVSCCCKIPATAQEVETPGSVL